jgi:NADH dehydrogenase
MATRDSGAKVVIVGAGFAGLWAARRLGRKGFSVRLMDRNNYHTFLPLIYQAATAVIEPEQIAYPLRAVFKKHPRVSFTLAEVREADFAARVVRTARGREYSYDYLVLAPGSETTFFGVPGAAEHAFRLKSLEQAIGFRNHALACFERAAAEEDQGAARRLLTFVVVGGGPTGVEFAGALAELALGPLAGDFPGLNTSQVRVVLLEAAQRVLPTFPPGLSDYTLGRLSRMGVEVWLNSAVARVGADSVELVGGESLPTESVVWTAGVTGARAPGFSDARVSRGAGGRLLAGPTLQLPGHPEVFVAGDACKPGEADPPMNAPAAIAQGRLAAENISRLAAGKEPREYVYRDKGQLATIGRSAAVAVMWGRTFKGLTAWAVWLLVHLVHIIGFRNRLLVLVNWMWNYFFHERGIRIIFPSDPHGPEPGRLPEKGHQ